MIDTTFRIRRDEDTSSEVLVDGTFENADGRHIVLGLIDAVINSQKLRNLSRQVNAQEDDDEAAQEIRALMVTRSNLADVFEKAALEGRPVRVRSTIEVSVDDDVRR